MNVSVEQIVLLVHDHLIASAGNQSVETKPWGDPRERRQGGPAMGRREEASFHGLTGWRFGWVGGRASRARAKSVLPAPIEEDPAAANAVIGSQSYPVRPAIMSGIQCVHTTGEVPRRLLPPAKVTASYKQAVKGSPDASATGTASYRPCPWGYQQRQSSPATRDERQNRSRSVNSFPVFGIVSPTIAATKWPARTSSWQSVGKLRNIPRYGVRSIRTKQQG